MNHELDYKAQIVVSVSEGKTDIPYLRQPLNAYFREAYGVTCKTISIGGDITSDPNLNSSDIVKALEMFVETELRSGRDKIDEDIARNIIEVVQIIDIDQAYIDDGKIFEDKRYNKFHYERNGTYYKNKEDVLLRNKLKRENIEKLLSIDHIHIFNRDIPFSLYFYSVNIDDFHNENALNLSAEDKWKLSSLFERKYLLKSSNSGKIKLFNSIFNKTNPSDLPDGINNSWKYIKENNNSLNKCSNVYLIINKDKRN